MRETQRRWHVMGYRSDSLIDNYYFGVMRGASAAEVKRAAMASEAAKRENVKEVFASEIVG